MPSSLVSSTRTPRQSTIGGMLHDLPAFLAIAVVVVLTPGPATAIVVRNSMRGGPRAAWATTAGNSTGILAWALASVLGISALVAASEAAFAALKLVGAAVLVWLGVQARGGGGPGLPGAAPGGSPGGGRAGVCRRRHCATAGPPATTARAS